MIVLDYNNRLIINIADFVSSVVTALVIVFLFSFEVQVVIIMCSDLDMMSYINTHTHTHYDLSTAGYQSHDLWSDCS